jgi:hypothetical protein
MSGGHFDYNQYRIGEIADSVERMIELNNSEETNERGENIGYNYSPGVIEQFKVGLQALREAQVYAQRIDWLVSGDDGEQSFLVRLADELEQLRKSC